MGLVAVISARTGLAGVFAGFARCIGGDLGEVELVISYKKVYGRLLLASCCWCRAQLAISL